MARSLSIQEQFEVFWENYPRRVGKGNARKKFEQAMKKTTLDVILAALAWQVQQPDWLKDGGTYIPYPSSYLNAERWTDEPLAKPAPAMKGADIAAEQQQKMQVLHTLLAQGVARPEALRRAGF
jgi:hypothetical protein